MQGETLDALKEGVAVFGADGRMKLINPAFAALWRFDPARAADRPHIDEVARALRAAARRRAVCGTGFARRSSACRRTARGFETRVERKDGLVLDCAALPLPDGATLLDFPRRDRGRRTSSAR